MATTSYQQFPLNPNKSKITKKNLILISFTVVTLISLAYLGLVNIQKSKTSPKQILSVCEKSHDPISCLNFINEATVVSSDVVETSSWMADANRTMLLKILSTHVLDINKVIVYVTKRSSNNVIQTTRSAQALEDCLELMDLSRDRVSDSIKTLTKYTSNKYDYINVNNLNNDDDDNNNIRTWLSGVLTNHVTCMDQLENESQLLGIKSIVDGLISRARVLLEIYTRFSPSIISINSGENFMQIIKDKTSYPTWVRKGDRKLLGVTGNKIEADLVVAKDGSGNFTTVGEAVAAVPDKGRKRYVIYVKEGVYEENVEVGKKKKNVMIIGDGMNLTIISGSENVVDGNTTFKSATLAAVGDGFILQDICIQNTAGPEKHQAVALRVGADKSIINRCQIDAYQDTLYTHSLRQFYTYSSISGTVDFIFGNAAVVFQNCQLIARKPMTSQKNMVTAQGRTDPNQNTGTTIQYCDIVPAPDLEPVISQFPTFLGRPWKNFSRTVVMQSNVSDHIDPTGWAKWDGDFALDTLYYGEYLNYGLGSDTSKRVNWTGYHVINDVIEAKQFTVGDFIQGQEWLDEAGVTFVEGL